MAPPTYLSGVAWSGVNACSTVLLPLAIYVCFARMVSPELIGAVGLSASCIEILKTFALPGLYESLLQQRDDQKRYHETASFVLLTSAFSLLLVYLITLTMLRLYIAQVALHYFAFAGLGLRIPFDLAALQPQARLALRLAFGRLAVRAMLSISIGGVIGMVTVLLADPFTGLIVYQVCQSLVFLITTIMVTGAAARPRLHLQCFHSMRREATLATGVRLLAATANNLDQIIVAALIGSIPLAYYNLGKRIELAFVAIAASFTGILFQPLFAQDNIELRGRTLRRGIAVLTMVLGLPAAAFLPNSTFLITTVFGQQWKDASVIAAIMATGGFIRAISFLPGALMSVSMRNRELLVTMFASALIGAALVALTAPFGALWCAVALLITQLGIVGRLVATERNGTARPVRTYLAGLVAPFLLMLAGSLAGRWIVGDPATGNGAVHQVLMLATSTLFGVAAGAGYFACYFRQLLARRYETLRGLLTP